MRVISQDGTLDFPYELSTIRVYNEIISMGMCKDDSCRSVIARYSTEAKALKAIEMLRGTYASMPIMMQNVDVSEDMAKEFERLKKCGIMVRAENQPSKVDFINNAVFQFPQDDEIEV
jgi:hypothetical protein|nr:MAG TPA: hypothetical protein [Caudoviricetes sp.]DAX07337.1 MAG TPA: hypothetical protein [Bacteriophage sp.]